MFNSRLMTALAFTALGAGAASAADLSRPYFKAPVFAESYYNWSGFYVGGQLGGSWTNQSWVNTANNSRFGDLAPGQGFGQRSSGIFGGGQIGYNWQASNYVFGLEGSIAGMNNRGTVNNTVFGLARDDVFSWRTNWMATVTGRVGYAFAPRHWSTRSTPSPATSSPSSPASATSSARRSSRDTDHGDNRSEKPRPAGAFGCRGFGQIWISTRPGFCNNSRTRSYGADRKMSRR
jgi:hypothetical protein